MIKRYIGILNKRDFLYTTISSYSQALANFLSIVLLARIVGIDAFSDVVLIKSIAGSLVPIITFCSGIFLARCSEEEARQYFLASICLTTVILIAIFGVCSAANIFGLSPEYISALDVNGDSYIDLYIVFIFAIFCVVRISEGYSRGIENDKRAAFIRGVISPISLSMPLVVVLFGIANDQDVVQKWSYASAILVPLVLYFSDFSVAETLSFFKKNAAKKIWRVMSWGAGRIPSGFLKVSLGTVALLVANGEGDARQVSYVAAVFYLYRFFEVFAGAFSPSLVRFGAKISYLGENNFQHVRYISAVIFVLSIFISIILYFLHDFLVGLIFGEIFIFNDSSINKLIVVAALPGYMLLVYLKPLLEGLYEYPISTPALFIAWALTSVVLPMSISLITKALLVLLLVPSLSVGIMLAMSMYIDWAKSKAT